MDQTKTCGVRMWRHGVDRGCKALESYTYIQLVCELDCTNEGCRFGCFKPARFANPHFNVQSADVGHRWWLYQYNYAEWLCADHYDEVMDTRKEYEDIYGEEVNDDGS